MKELKEAAAIVVSAEKGAALERVASWTREQVDLIKRTVCPQGTTDDEFQLFVAQCQRTGLDPLIKEAFCVRRSKKLPSGAYGDENVFQAAESGMRARAQDFPDFRGLVYGVVREGDVFDFHPKDGNKIDHHFNPADPARTKKPIMGAWAWVQCEGRITSPVWLPLSERIQTTRDGKITSMWLKTETMIAKCARAEALRIAYPKKWGGTRIDAEFADDEIEPEAAPQIAASSRTASVAAKIQAKTSRPTPPGAKTVEDSRPRVPFGREGIKGRPIVDLSADELSEAEQVGAEQLAKNPQATWAPPVRAALDALKAERDRRMSAIIEEPPPFDEAMEPGSAG